MKKFFSKKPVKVIISIFVVLALVVCICNAVFASVALDLQKGVAVCDEWSPDDVYTPDYAQSLEVGDGDYKILCLTDVHIRNHGTFASWLGINFILDGMSEIQLKKLINRVEPDLILVGGDTVLTKWNDICTQQFCDFMEKFEIPWAPVFGNHDYEGRADKAKLAEIYEAAAHCLFKSGPEGMNGMGNYMGVQRDGSFQEYITMPIERIIDGKGLSAQQLALIEPFSISNHALSRAKVNAGDNLLIMGAGPIGLFALLKAKAMGARVAIADMLQSRLALAKEYGADLVISVKETNLADECKKFTDGNGFDVCVEACGAPETFLNCIDNSAHGANIILIGNGKRETTFVYSVILKKELNIFGNRNAFTKDFEELIDLVKAEKVNPLKMISGIYDAENAAAAFDALAHNDGSLAKLLINFSDAE